MTVRLRGAEAVKAPPLLFRAEHRIPLPATSLPGIYAPEIRHMGRLPDSDKSVRSKYRLKSIYPPAVLKIRCNFVIQKNGSRCKACVRLFQRIRDHDRLSLSSEHSSRLLILGFMFFLYSSGICGEQVPKRYRRRRLSVVG